MISGYKTDFLALPAGLEEKNSKSDQSPLEQRLNYILRNFRETPFIPEAELFIEAIANTTSFEEAFLKSNTGSIKLI